MKKISKQEIKKLDTLFQEYSKFYDLPPRVKMQDITEEVLRSPYTKDAQKKAIQRFKRSFLVFHYPSDGLKVKGVISFVPDPHNHPTLVLLRGGNRTFGILNPGSDLMCPEQYTVISTTYRDGVSEGVDEYGGQDVNDVKNLIDFMPKLESKLGLHFQKEKMFMLGMSRGVMQLFLALARFPELQSHFSKIVSLSGLLDMRQCIAERAEMEEMFINDFGLKKGYEEDWIKKRNPLEMIDCLKQKLPMLIIQGTDDNRVSLTQGKNMVDKLLSAGHDVTYWEIKRGNHCLKNKPNRMKAILDWLEE